MKKRDEALAELEREWTQLRSAVESVPESELTAPGVVDDWSIKDIVGHVAFWADRGAKTLAASNAGNLETLTWGEGDKWVDEWNARESEARKDKSYKDVRAEWITAHEAARNALERATDETLNAKLKRGTVWDYYEGDTTTHYKEHAGHIKAWLREMETTEK